MESRKQSTPLDFFRHLCCNIIKVAERTLLSLFRLRVYRLPWSVSIDSFLYNPSVSFADSSLYTKEPFADFAARIGADFYAADGMGVVHVVKEFFEK